MKRWILAAFFLTGCLLSGASAIAQDMAAQRLVTMDQLLELQNQLDELRAAQNSPPPTKEEKKTFPDFKVTGFFQLDSAYFDQSDESVATLGDIQDGTGFRRARIAATGNLTERASYLMEFDFAQAQARFVDVWGQIKESPLGNVRIGRYRQPFGMSELTSVRELPFLERPTIFALSPFRQTGIMLFDTADDEQMT